MFSKELTINLLADRFSNDVLFQDFLNTINLENYIKTPYENFRQIPTERYNFFIEKLREGTSKVPSMTTIFKYATKFFYSYEEESKEISKFVSNIQFFNDYEHENLTIIKVDFVAPLEDALLLDKVVRESYDETNIIFTFKFERVALDGQLRETELDNPFEKCWNDVELVPIDTNNDYGLLKTADITRAAGNTIAEQEAKYRLSIFFIGLEALLFLKGASSFQRQQTTCGQVIESLVDELRCSNNLKFFVDSSPNTNLISVFLNGHNASDAVRLCDDNYGVFKYGHLLFTEGNICTIRDKQLSPLDGFPNNYTNIIHISKQGKSSENLRGVKFETLTDGTYLSVCMISEDQATPVDNTVFTQNKYGNELMLFYKVESTNVLLPRDVSSNSVDDVSSTHYLYKNADNSFFETQLISDYVTPLKTVAITLYDVNPDLFHIQSEVYIDFDIPTHRFTWSGKYRILQKNVMYSAPPVSGVKLQLELSKSISEETYNLADLLSGAIYRYDPIASALLDTNTRAAAIMNGTTTTVNQGNQNTVGLQVGKIDRSSKIAKYGIDNMSV